MEKKLSELDAEMIIIARKYLDDCLYYDYSGKAKQASSITDFCVNFKCCSK